MGACRSLADVGVASIVAALLALSVLLFVRLAFHFVRIDHRVFRFATGPFPRLGTMVYRRVVGLCHIATHSGLCFRVAL